MSIKVDNFNRLAEKRLETILDQIRVFSNLSGPSYEFTPEMVVSYLDRIREGIDQTLLRFQEARPKLEWTSPPTLAPTPPTPSSLVEFQPRPGLSTAEEYAVELLLRIVTLAPNVEKELQAVIALIEDKGP